ncbi:MAG TPA: HAMP domain-containing sensor histidine kinase [Myxococcales bacterium]
MRHGRTFWKVYVHGVLMLLVIAVSVGLVGWAFGRAPKWRNYPERLATYLSARAADLDHPEIIERDLKRENELLGVEATIYRLDGTLVATNIDPPIPALKPQDAARLHTEPIHAPREHLFAMPIREGGKPVAYLVLRGLPFAHQLSRMAMMLVVVALALAAGSFPLARTITKPLDALTAAARRLGSGDLSTRTGLKRKDEVGELATAFDEMADRLQKLVQGEKELLANVSHELRTPLARIRVALELASEGDAEKARAYLGDIATDLGELERLVEDVLSVARLDLMQGKGGAPPLRLERVPSQTILEASAERFRSARPERKLEVLLGTGLPDVQADPSMLRRVVDNLLDNAAKYSEIDKPVALNATAAEGKVVVEIRDEGIGIEEKDLPNLFRPFFRTERSRSRKAGGVGLGLALAKRIVEAHGGTIAVESAPGKGTTVRFEVPAAA